MHSSFHVGPETVGRVNDGSTTIGSLFLAKRRCLHVLVADDSAGNQQLLRLVLSKHGHDAFAARDGNEAVEQWRKGDFDIILMDVSMPVMNGFAATRRIRAEETASGGHIPIVAMTAHTYDGVELNCLDSGMDAYICKPLCINTLLETVERVAAMRFRSKSSAREIQRVPPCEIQRANSH